METTLLEEISRYSIEVTNYVEPITSWSDMPLIVNADNGLQVLEFGTDVKYYSKNLDFNHSTILPPKTSPGTRFLQTHIETRHMRNIDLTELMVNSSLWPYNNDIMDELATFTASAFSPKSFSLKDHTIIATLTNIGNIEFFGRRRLGWKSILNLSTEIENLKKGSTVKYDSLSDITQAVLIFETSAFCWGSSVSKNQCYFGTGQKNGDILFWSLCLENNKINAKLFANVSTEIGQFTIMVWVRKDNISFSLFASNILGQVYIMDFCIENDSINITKTNCLWPYKDNSIVNNIEYVKDKEGVIVMFTKQRHLIIQRLDSHYSILSQCHKILNDHKISCLRQVKSGIFVSTVNCQLFKVNLPSNNDTSNVEIVSFPIKCQFPDYELRSFCFSPNEKMLCLSLLMTKICSRKEPIMLELSFLILNESYDIIFNNPNQSLYDIWDVLEVLRVKTMKNKALLDYDYKELYEKGKSCLYDMKLYLIFLQWHKKMFNNLYLLPAMPEESIEKVKESIIFLHAQELLRNPEKLKLSNTLSILSQSRAYKYLLYYSEKYRLDISQCIDLDLASKLKETLVEEVCEYCGKNMTGFFCSDIHASMFCCITLTSISIGDDYIYCRNCNSTACVELDGQSHRCIFCDFSFIKI